jgi:hypothetical protein
VNLQLARQQKLVAAALWLFFLPACGTSDGGSAGTSTDGATDASSSSSAASTGGPTADPTTGAPTTGAPDATTGAPDPTTGATPTDTGATTQEPDGTTAPAPTDGPGVLPGESGLDAFCRRFKECGGEYYEDAQACIDASHDYWGDCPTRQAALDAFGACMSELDCGDWSPDNYNPNGTPCAEQWQQLGASRACA